MLPFVWIGDLHRVYVSIQKHSLAAAAAADLPNHITLIIHPCIIKTYRFHAVPDEQRNVLLGAGHAISAYHISAKLHKSIAALFI